jgi:hypothetical protein
VSAAGGDAHDLQEPRCDKTRAQGSWHAHFPWPACRYHLGVTYHGPTKTATLYVDGQPVQASSNFNMPLAVVGAMTQPWLGASQWGAPFTDGAYQDFRFYTGALRSVHLGGVRWHETAGHWLAFACSGPA